jgi:acetyl esterase
VSVHPQIQTVIDKTTALNLPAIQSLSPEAAREQFIFMVNARPVETAPIQTFERQTIAGPAGDIPVNVYRPLPEDVAGAGVAPPLLMYFHGGGHVMGNPDTHDAVARNLCAGSGAVVVSVDYRKGPEHRFPGAVEDAVAATRWCAGNAAELVIDPARIAVAGDSAGGNLAAVTALALRDEGGPDLALQVLIYPVADYNCRSPSYDRCGTGYGLLEADTMRWFRKHYLGDDVAVADDWRASPLKATSHANLPPALVLTAEFDVLHDEGVALADAMRDAGTKVTHTEYPGMIHGFFSLTPIVDGAVAAQAEVCAAVREAFGG